ncbi:MAG: hypothetical protein WC802_03105 [Patescibacteria group bacterium]
MKESEGRKGEEEKETSFGPAFDEDYEQFLAHKREARMKYVDKLVELKLLPADKRDSAIEEGLAKYTGNLDPLKKAGYLLNNFSLWLPGGGNRTLEAQSEEERRTRQRLVADLDECLFEAGYSLTFDDIRGTSMEQGADVSKEALYKQYVDLYLRMRAKGYSQEDLAR